MLQKDNKYRKFEDERCIIAQDYINVEIKEECNSVEDTTAKILPNSVVHISQPSLSDGELIIPDLIEFDDTGTGNPTGAEEKFKSSCLQDQDCQTGKSFEFMKYQKFQTEQFKQVYSLLYPRYLQGSNCALDVHSHSNCTPNPEVVQQIKTERESEEITENNLFALHFQLSSWENERILRRREQNRKRKALQRALETEEQKNLRLKKERLAKAALRAMEPLEKRLIRREKDRIAKATSRALETEEQRKIRREKNRMAMAALRAAQSEEQRYARRERDRIKKATIRAFETEEQKKIRREKNRVAMAIRRANLSDQERNCLRNSNRIPKNGTKSCLREERAFMVVEDNLGRDIPSNCKSDSLQRLDFRESYSESMILEQIKVEEPGLSSEENEENSEYMRNKLKKQPPGFGDISLKILLESPSTSNQSTSISGLTISH